MTSGDQERAIIIGAGPAGLTAAFELLTRTGIKTHRPREERLHWRHRPDGELQGQPHRHRRASLLLEIRPCHGLVAEDSSPANVSKDSGYDPVPRCGASRHPSASVPDTDSEDRVMLLRRRKSRIYYMRHFFEYPISFNWDALVKIGFWRACKMGLSYIGSALFPLKQQDTREQFLINRFGRELYRWFFKSYQVVYGKDLGRSVHSDQRRVGHPTH